MKFFRLKGAGCWAWLTCNDLIPRKKHLGILRILRNVWPFQRKANSTWSNRSFFLYFVRSRSRWGLRCGVILKSTQTHWQWVNCRELPQFLCFFFDFRNSPFQFIKAPYFSTCSQRWACGTWPVWPSKRWSCAASTPTCDAAKPWKSIEIDIDRGFESRILSHIDLKMLMLLHGLQLGNVWGDRNTFRKIHFADKKRRILHRLKYRETI